MPDFFKKKTIRWGRELRSKLVDILEEDAIPRIKDIIMEDYDFNLNDIANPKSKLAPDNYAGEFLKRLDDFDYIDLTAKGVRLTTPDMENFDFRDGLEPVETILEGMIGRYVEVEHDDYQRVTGRSTYRGKRMDVYLIKYTNEVRDWEKDLDKKFEEYAFSNSPPIDIFERAEIFVNENMEKWIDDAIKKSQKEFEV
jgi:hypothetical protein